MLYLFPTITKQTNLLIGHYPAADRKWKCTDTALCGCKQGAVALQQCFYKSPISSSRFVYDQNSSQLERRGDALCKYSIFTSDPECKSELFIKTKKYSGFSCLVLGFVFDKYFCLGSEDSNTLESRKISINRLSRPDDLQTENTNKSAVGWPVVEISCCSSWYLNDTQVKSAQRKKSSDLLHVCCKETRKRSISIYTARVL